MMYESFAQVYDTFMDNVPYDEWGEFIIRRLKEHGIEDGLVLDLGCGTGSMTEYLAEAGYDMTGIDNAEEMLQIAQNKKLESGLDILYLEQDMREFELYGTMRAIVSVCDSFNYLTREEELLETFKLVNNYLDPGGLFIFDMNTMYKYRELEGDQTFAEAREDCSFIWENTWYEEEKINEYDLTLFCRQEDGLYRRFDEVHYQRGYERETIEKLLEAAGLKLLAEYDSYTESAPGPETDRICYVACETMKRNILTND